jgi:hypothetical protein
MQYQIPSRGWAAGPTGFVEGGTVIDTSQLARTAFTAIPPPPGALAIDQAAYDVLAQLYPAWAIYSVPGINRWKNPLG